MKLSKYNYIINNDAYDYWFNGLQFTYVKIEKTISKKLQIHLNTLDTLNDIAPTFFNKLKNNGFIIDDNTDEIQFIKDNYIERINSKNYFLIIMPTMDCNFNCWYCVQNHKQSKMTEATINNIIKHIDTSINVDKIESLNIEWFGGEPFMYLSEVVTPITKAAQKLCSEAKIPFYNTATTNGYYLTPDKLNTIEDLSLSRFQITLDGTKELHDKVKFTNGCESTFVHVLNNIDTILSNTDNVSILLRINYTETNLDSAIVEQVNRHITQINRSKIHVTLKKVWQENINHTRIEKIKEIYESFKQSGYNIKSQSNLITDFIPCYACKKYYNAINYDGYVHKCTAKSDLTPDSAFGKLNDDGTISFNENLTKKYCGAHLLTVSKCLNCKHLPLCMGSCPGAYDADENFCKMQQQDETIKDTIVNYIDNQINHTI